MFGLNLKYTSHRSSLSQYLIDCVRIYCILPYNIYKWLNLVLFSVEKGAINHVWREKNGMTVAWANLKLFLIVLKRYLNKYDITY